MSKQPLMNRLIPFTSKFIISYAIPPIVIKVSVSKPNVRERERERMNIINIITVIILPAQFGKGI